MKLVKSYRHYMSLIELLIGMALTMVLLSVLTYFYQQVELINKESEKTQKEIFQLQLVENRLAQVLTKALAEQGTGKFYFFTTGDLGLFSPGSQSLVFEFDSGVDLDNNRAETALGRLFLDKKNRLSLATWSNPDDWDAVLPKARNEILMENVKSLKFSFFVAPDRDRSLVPGHIAKKNQAAAPAAQKDKEPLKPPVQPPTTADDEKEETSETSSEIAVTHIEPMPKGEWIHDWKKEYNHLPALMKVEVLLMEQDDKDPPKVFAFPLLKSHKVIVYELGN